MFKFTRFSPFFLFLKAIFFLTTGVYVLALPTYAYVLAYPNGWIDFLLPFEVVICIFLSVISFCWAGLTVKELFKK